MDSSTAGTQTIDDAVAARLPDAVRETAAQEGFSGVVRVSSGGTLVYEEAFGLASRRWSVPVVTSTRFDVASVTKLFTSVAVLQQVDAGTLDLDAPIGTWLALAETTISPEITLRQLLSHTSGIADDADEEDGESYEDLWVDRPSYSVTTTADFLPQFAHKPPRAAPGEDCRYCNVGYVLAGLVLESVTGTPYREHVVEHVFGRAGMDRAGFFHMRDAEPDVAEGWDPVHEVGGADGDEDGAEPGAEVGRVVGWKQNIYSYPPIGSPDGGAHVSARDLETFMSALRGGRLLSPELTEAFLTPQVLHHEDDDVALWYALGLEIEVRPDGSVRSLSKDGINTGASAILRWYPASDTTVAVVSNSEAGAWAPITTLDTLLAG